MSKPSGAIRLAIVPVTLPIANDYVRRWHRHHDAIPAGFVWYSVAAVTDDGSVVGVGIAGRPTNRNNDDGQTVEVLRVATDGQPNACSAIYGSCARAAKAIGAARIITYTLDDETGGSLRGSGWAREAEGITSSWLRGTSRRTAISRPHMEQTKVRWAVHFRDVVPVSHPEPVEQPQMELAL